MTPREAHQALDEPPRPAPASGAPRRGVGLALGLGVVITLATARSLLGVMNVAIPALDCGRDGCADQALLLWLLTTAGRRLYGSPLSLFEAPVFHPMRHALAYSESMLSAAVFVGPIDWLTGNPILAYNLHYLATIVLSVVGMFLLVREITGDGRAGLVAGALFGLATERGFWWTFPPALAVHWAPVLLWAWIRFLGAPSWRRGIGLGLALLAHMHSGAYHGLMLPALLVPWAAVLALFGPWSWRRWAWSAIPLGIAGAVGAALYYPYVVVQDELQYDVHAALAIALPSQYLDGLLHPLAYVTSRITGPAATAVVSPLAWYVVVAAAVGAVLRPRPTSSAPRLGPHVAAAIVLTLLAVAVSFGPMLLTPFGLVPGPLALLRVLPGFAAMRAMVRFMVLAAFGRSLVAGIAVAALLRRLPASGARLVAIGLVVLAALDARLGAALPVSDLTIPPEWARGYAWLAGTDPDAAILELPYGSFGGDAHYMVYALQHRRRLMNGYSAVLPRFPDLVGRVPNEVGWRGLRAAGVQYVVAHPSELTRPLRAAQLAALRERSDLLVASLDDTLVFAVPPAHTAPDPPLGVPLPHDGWRVTLAGAEAAIDGDVATHWLANSRTSDVSLRINLRKPVHITDIVLDLGEHMLEYPRRYEVRALHGNEWTLIGRASPTPPPFESYRRDHRHVMLRLDVRPASTQWIELRVPAYPRNAWTYTTGVWAIHELLVYGTPEPPR